MCPTKIASPSSSWAKLPVARELVAIIACTQEIEFIARGDLAPSARVHIDVCEVEYEDGTRSRLEVCVGALTRTIRSGTLELPVMAVVVTRGDELHGWYPIAPGCGKTGKTGKTGTG